MRTTELLARMRLDASQFDRSLKQSSAELQTFARVTNALPAGRNNPLAAIASDASAIVPALTSAPLAIAAVGAAMTAAGVAARRAGVEFEASLTKIATLGEDAQNNIGATRQAILETFASTAITGGVTDLAEANYLLQSSGRSAADAISDLDTAAKASVAGYTQVTTAVDGLTTVTAAWKDQQISTKQASDVLFAAVNVGKASFEEIAQSLGLVAPLAASAGVRFEEVAAATALLSNQGLRTSSIMEGLRSAILNIQRPTEDFKKKYADLAREFGASRLARDGIIQFLRDFNTASGGSRAALGALFSDATGLTTALGLLRNNGDDAAASLRQMENAAGAADKALAQVNKSTAAQEQLVRNQISSAWTQFGELLNSKTLPILERLARIINEVTDGAAFASRDVDALLAKSGSDLLGGRGIGTPDRGFDQVRALRGVVGQFNDNRGQFLASLSRDQLANLGPELIRLRATGRFQDNPRTAITADLINAVVDERLRRDSQTATEQQNAFTGQQKTQADADARAKDEQAQRDREKAAADADRAKAEADRKAKELAAQRQRLVDDAVKLTQDLESQALEALQGTAGALQGTMEQVLSEGAKKLASGVLSPEASAALRAQLEQFEELQTQLITAERAADDTRAAIAAALQQEEIPALNTIAARERELQVILDGTTNLAARKKIEEQLAALAKARGEQTEGTFGMPSGDAIQSKVREIGDLAQSIATLGDQLGLIPRQAVDAVRGIGALVEQGAKLSEISKAGGFSKLGLTEKLGLGLGIAGGVASFATALFGSSPEDRARQAALKANTDAIKSLTQNIGDLSNAAVSGGSLSRVLAAASSSGLRVGDLQRDALGTLAGTGLASRGEIERVAQALGVTLNGAVSVADLISAIRQADLGSYVDTFAGSLQRLQDTITLDGVTDPIEILRRRIATLTDAKTGFPALAQALAGVDISTADGRSEAERRARAVFDSLASGSLSASQLGGLSITDARGALIDLITQLRDGTGASTGTGGFNETRSITEVTGSRLAGLLGSANTFLAQIAADIATLRSALVVGPPVVLSPPSLAGITSTAAGVPGVVIQSLTVSVTITRDLLGADAGSAIALGDTLSRSIAGGLVSEIDAQLRERSLRQRLLQGDARVTT